MILSPATAQTAGNLLLDQLCVLLDYLMSSSTGHSFQERVFFRSRCPRQDTSRSETPLVEPYWVNTGLGLERGLQRCPEQFSQA